MTFLDIFSKTKTSQNHGKSPPLSITIDHREKNSLVISELNSLGFKMEFKQLPVADYIMGKTAVERKTISDFKSSIINKRIISQLLELKQYPNPILILEGLEEENPYEGGIHENAFRGFLLSIISEYQVPIIFTLNEKDTAKYLYVLAKKSKPSAQGIRASKTHLSKKEQLQFILEGFPHIGPVAAKKLLSKFKSLHSLFNASQEELQEVIGKKSEDLYSLLHFKYH
jgi:ERCC4-type nuclease